MELQPLINWLSTFFYLLISICMFVYNKGNYSNNYIMLLFKYMYVYMLY